MDPTIAKMIDVKFVEQSNVFSAMQNRTMSGDQAVAELVRNSFGFAGSNAAALVGAHAAQELGKSGLASDILQQRSAGVQPGTGASGGAK